MEQVDGLLRLLRESKETSWVADQLVASFAQGVSMNVKDAITDGRFFELAPYDISRGDERKRQTYETTRPYTDTEKLDLIKQALKALFVELPTVQVAGFRGLLDLGAHVSNIEFLAPEDSEENTPSYSRDFSDTQGREQVLSKNLEEFLRKLDA